MNTLSSLAPSPCSTSVEVAGGLNPVRGCTDACEGAGSPPEAWTNTVGLKASSKTLMICALFNRQKFSVAVLVHFFNSAMASFFSFLEASPSGRSTLSNHTISFFVFSTSTSPSFLAFPSVSVGVDMGRSYVEYVLGLLCSCWGKGEMDMLLFNPFILSGAPFRTRLLVLSREASTRVLLVSNSTALSGVFLISSVWLLSLAVLDWWRLSERKCPFNLFDNSAILSFSKCSESTCRGEWRTSWDFCSLETITKLIKHTWWYNGEKKEKDWPADAHLGWENSLLVWRSSSSSPTSTSPAPCSCCRYIALPWNCCCCSCWDCACEIHSCLPALATRTSILGIRLSIIFFIAVCCGKDKTAIWESKLCQSINKHRHAYH